MNDELRSHTLSGRPLSAIVEEAHAGNEKARDELFAEMYDRLRAIAKKMMLEERVGHTLQPTAVVHEFWIRVRECERLELATEGTFVATAIRAMRCILIDYARAHKAQKRGGNAARVELREVDHPVVEDVTIDAGLNFDHVLEELKRVDQRQYDVVKMKHYLGWSVEFIAAALDVSPRTVAGDWNIAKAWIVARLANH